MVFQFGTSLDKERKPERQIPGTTPTSRRIQEYQNRGDKCAMDLAELIKTKYRGLECQGCTCFMGYQHRYDRSITVCSGACMLKVDQKIQAYKQQANGSSCKGTCGLGTPTTLGMPPQPQPYMQPLQPSLLGAPPGMTLVPIPNPYGPGLIYAYIPSGFVPPMPPPAMFHPHQQIPKFEHRRYHPSNCGNSGGSSGAAESTENSPTSSSGLFETGQAQPVDSSTPKQVGTQNGFGETSSSTMDGSIDNSPIQFSPTPTTETVLKVDYTEPMLLERKDGKEQAKRALNLNGVRVEIPMLKETETPMSANLLDVASSGNLKSTALVEKHVPRDLQESEMMKKKVEVQVEAAVSVALPQVEADIPVVVIKTPKDFNERSMAMNHLAPAAVVKVETQQMSSKPDVQQEKLETAQNVTTQVTRKVTTANKNLLKNIVLSTSLYDQAECVWNYIWTPTKFTLTANADAEKIAEMGDRLMEYCDEAPGMTRMPMVGEIVYAPYDGVYYRAVVAKRNLDKKILKVEFVDFGDYSNLSLEDCREPTADINYPIFGITLHLTCDQQFPPEVQQEIMDAIETTFKGPVYIHMEKKIDEFNWAGEIYLSTKPDDTISNFLNSYVPKKQLVEEESVNRDPTSETSSAVSAKPKKTVNAETAARCSSKLESDAESVSSKKRQVFQKKKDEDPSSVVLAKCDEAPKNKTQSATPEARKPRPEPEQSSTSKTKQLSEKKQAEVPFQSKPIVAKREKSTDITVPKNTSRPSPPSLLIQDAEFSKALKHSAQVRINYMFTMSRLLVYAIKDEDNLSKLTVEIENYVTKAPGLNRMPVVNEILIAPYQGVYYRGKVVSFDEQFATVRFLDYGDQEKVPITEMKEIPDSIRKIPIYGLELAMIGVPSDMPFFESKLIEAIFLKTAQLQMLDKVEPGVFNARLWFGTKDDANWASIVNAEYTADVLMKNAASK